MEDAVERYIKEKGIGRHFIDKLYRMPAEYRDLVYAGEYGRAKTVYNTASALAVFLELPHEMFAELFGYAPEDGEEVIGLFPRDTVLAVDWKCCIQMHMTYQDEACRRAGEPVRHYSEEDFCAMCRKWEGGSHSVYHGQPGTVPDYILWDGIDVPGACPAG